jgi:hypothetical protein
MLEHCQLPWRLSGPIHRSLPNHSYTGGKSADCSEGERPDTMGNAPHPITRSPNRGLGAGVTATPQPEEPLYAPYRGANVEYRNIGDGTYGKKKSSTTW